MPLIFTKAEIRRHLAEYGFDGIEDHHLSMFIVDLKRLIKHEEKKRRERRALEEQENDYPTTPPSYYSDAVIVSSFASPGSSGEAEVGATTAPDNVDTKTKKEEPIKSDLKPEGVKKQPEKKQKQALRERTPTDSQGKEKEKRKPKLIDTNRVSTTSSDDPISSSSSSLNSYAFSSSYGCDSDISSENGFNRRPKLPPKSVRHDPVSLYHFYKSIWDKQKGPGENPRMKLRWNVRAGTLGRVPCDPCGVPIKYLR